MPACKDGWVFHSTATAWYSATESRIVFIYYKEGNGERKYGYSIREDCVPDWDDNVTTNYLYNSRDCDDFRKNYRYMAGPCWYFGDNVDLHISSDINEWKFYSTATAWHSATEPVIIYIFYKEGNGRRKYYYSTENGKNPHWLDLVERNEEYNNGNYSDYRSRYPYKAGYRVFDLPGFSL
ncbi:MAG: hypothetical protein J6X58_04400 [Bacteroidales bacterium]|nr:hypothetical protein [Bacteroidales bacterium]